MSLSASQSGVKRFLLAALLLTLPLLAEIAMVTRSTAATQSSKVHTNSNSIAVGRGVASIDQETGRRLFLRDCAHCHGVSGNGSSPVRSTLHPTPLDLTGFDLAESFVLDLLHEGVPGSDMPAWHNSPEEDLRAISRYTAQLGHSDTLASQDLYASPDALQEAGHRIYMMHCSRCHGEKGAGDGKDAARYLPSPPSFQGIRPSYVISRRVIENGVPGTAMPSWPLLTPQEVQAVTFYIRSLYAEAQPDSSSLTGARQ